MDEELAIASISQHLREALTLLEGQSDSESEEHPLARRRINSADKAWEVFKEMRRLEQEELWVLALNNALDLFGLVKLYRGNATSAIVRPAEVFREAVRLGATGVIIAHNHPAGDPRPSIEDIETTKAVAMAGKILDIQLLDHLVIGRQSYTPIMRDCPESIKGWKKPQEATTGPKARWVERLEL